MTESPTNLPEKPYRFDSPFGLHGGYLYHHSSGPGMFPMKLPDTQRALFQNLLSEDEIYDLRSRISAILPSVFESLFSELSLETFKHYQRMAARVESIERDYRRLRAEVASLRELVRSYAPPSVSKVLENVHNEASSMNPQDRKVLLKKAAEKRASGQQLDADALSEQIQSFVEAEIANTPDEDY